jgi:hypothetical protein
MIIFLEHEYLCTHAGPANHNEEIIVALASCKSSLVRRFEIGVQSTGTRDRTGDLQRVRLTS